MCVCVHVHRESIRAPFSKRRNDGKTKQIRRKMPRPLPPKKRRRRGGASESRHPDQPKKTASCHGRGFYYRNLVRAGCLVADLRRAQGRKGLGEDGRKPAITKISSQLKTLNSSTPAHHQTHSHSLTDQRCRPSKAECPRPAIRAGAARLPIGSVGR